jgi:hypothetical protein
MAKASLAMLLALVAAGCVEPAGPAATSAPAQVQALVLVCDSTHSMSGKLDAAKADMKRILSDVRSQNQFSVVCYDRAEVRQFGEGLRPGTSTEQAIAMQFVDSMKSLGRTKPKEALQRAMSLLASAPMRERALYFWSDGDFAPGSISETLTAANDRTSPVRLHFIVVVSPSVTPNEQVVAEMKQLAAQTGGSFRTISTSSGDSQ